MVLLEIVSRFLVQPVREGWAVFVVEERVQSFYIFVWKFCVFLLTLWQLKILSYDNLQMILFAKVVILFGLTYSHA